MVDYSQWLKTVSEAVRPGERTAIILAVLSVFCFAGMVIAFVGGIAFMGPSEEFVKANVRITAVMALGFVASVIALLFATASGPNGVEPFATHTENMYGIEHLRCDGADCPAYDLPADNTPAGWLKDGRLEQGRFIVDGHRVGLAGPDGELLKPVKR